MGAPDDKPQRRVTNNTRGKKVQWKERPANPAAQTTEVCKSKSREPQPVEIERMADSVNKLKSKHKLESVSGADNARIISSFVLGMTMRRSTMFDAMCFAWLFSILCEEKLRDFEKSPQDM